MNVFTDEEAAAILAGLRLLQHVLEGRRVEDTAFVEEILTDGGRLDPLNSDQLDDLCARIALEKD